MVRESIARQLGSPANDAVRLKADATYGEVRGVRLQPDLSRHAARGQDPKPSHCPGDRRENRFLTAMLRQSRH